MASDNSGNGILFIGGVAFVCLLGIGWWFAASTSNNAQNAAIQFAEATRSERNTLMNAADSAAQSVEETAEAAGENVAAAADAVEETADAAAEGAAEMAESAGEAAEGAAKEVAEATSDAAESAGDAAADAAESAQETAEAAVKSVTETAESASEAVEQAGETAVAEANEAADTATAAAAGAVAAIAGDAENGERVFKKCKACHMVGDNAKNRVGPVLNGIIDRPVASADGFKYSKALQDAGASGDVWSVEHLAAFLAKPKDYYKGTKMAFAGLRKESDAQDVIAYLAQFE